MRKAIVELFCILSCVACAAPVRSVIAATETGIGQEDYVLPYDTEVEWLKSVNGDCHIDTCLTISEFLLSIKTETANVGINALYMFGSGDMTSGVMLYRGGRYPSSAKRLYCDGAVLFQQYVEPVEIVEQAISSDSVEHSLLLFNTHTVDGQVRSGNGGFTCYYLTIKDVNGNVLLDFIPVRFTNEFGETEGAMYDKVSGQLFRNMGSGSFLIGPDL